MPPYLLIRMLADDRPPQPAVATERFVTVPSQDEVLSDREVTNETLIVTIFGHEAQRLGASQRRGWLATIDGDTA
jgi:hypothetical protein